MSGLTKKCSKRSSTVTAAKTRGCQWTAFPGELQGNWGQTTFILRGIGDRPRLFSLSRVFHCLFGKGEVGSSWHKIAAE